MIDNFMEAIDNEDEEVTQILIDIATKVIKLICSSADNVGVDRDEMMTVILHMLTDVSSRGTYENYDVNS